MDGSNYTDEIALKYAKEITSTYLDDKVMLSKNDLNSYLYWAFFNGMQEQKKRDVNKILFG